MRRTPRLTPIVPQLADPRASSLLVVLPTSFKEFAASPFIAALHIQPRQLNTTAMASKPAISPHVKGIDICGTKDFVCIIRSDLGCYMKCGGKLDSNQQLPIHPLSPSCADGDHYLCKDSTFYIIRGNSFICVNDLTEPTGLDITVKPLAENCENGDHYLSFGGNFCIIFTQKNEYLIVSDLTTGKVIESATIIKANQNGLYYYGSPSKGKITIVQQVSEWGAMYTLTSSLKELGENYFVYPDVINFLPGGLSTTFGPTEARWELLQSITNECKTAPLQWSEKITKTVGYNKSHFQSIEHNWNTTASVSMGTKYQS